MDISETKQILEGGFIFETEQLLQIDMSFETSHKLFLEGVSCKI